MSARRTRWLIGGALVLTLLAAATAFVLSLPRVGEIVDADLPFTSSAWWEAVR